MRSPVAGALLAALLMLTASCSSSDDGSGTTAGTTPLPSTPAANARFPHYVALGDSYSSGPGIDPQDDSGCGRSGRNYANLVARHFAGTVLTDVTCSGAATTNMENIQRTLGGTLAPPQFEAVSAQTDLITIGLGGNDGGFSRLLLQGCTTYTQSSTSSTPCTDVGTTRLSQLLVTIQANLTTTFRQLRELAPHAVIVAVGYPQIAPASGSCAQRLPIRPGDVPFVRQANQGLDDAVRAAAQSNGIDFADVWSRTAGHDICAEDPWINGIRNKPGLGAPFHPFAQEQEAAAAAVIAAIGDQRPGTTGNGS